MRNLKHHEKRLLKKVDFLEKNRRSLEVMRRYHIQRREDYTKCAQDNKTPLLPLSLYALLPTAL
jgi:hypothetical protein